jgi:hypothetical protein
MTNVAGPRIHIRPSPASRCCTSSSRSSPAFGGWSRACSTAALRWLHCGCSRRCWPSWRSSSVRPATVRRSTTRSGSAGTARLFRMVKFPSMRRTAEAELRRCERSTRWWRTALQAACRTPASPRSVTGCALLARRAPAAVERGVRAHVAGRTAPPAAPRSGQVRRRRAPAPAREAWHDWAAGSVSGRSDLRGRRPCAWTCTTSRTGR